MFYFENSEINYYLCLGFSEFKTGKVNNLIFSS